MTLKTGTRLSNLYIPWLGIAVFVAAWSAGAAWLNDTNVLPGPGRVLSTFIELAASGRLLDDVWASLSRVLQGWGLVVLIAIPLGGVMGRAPLLQRVMMPLIELIRPIPPIAMVPLSILWFGIDKESQLFIVFYGAFFPTIIGSYDALRDVDKIYENAARSLGRHGLFLFLQVTLRAAAPRLLSTLRIGLGLAFISLVAAEMIAASSGLGALIANSRVLFQTDYVIVGMIMIGLTGFSLGWVMRRLERRLTRYLQP